jgi:predicted glycoside hydrolase/deacetylase ChbG (UPF0249 family)
MRDKNLVSKTSGESDKAFSGDRCLVINADDFGLSAEVNEGILTAHEKGILTSTSLMANGPMFSQAASIGRQVPNLGIGVHFNLVRGKPVSRLQDVNLLVDIRGLFPGTVSSTLHRLVKNPAALDQAERECTAQVERLIEAGIRPTHIDSEKHIHMFPPLFKRVAEVAASNDIKWIRIVNDGDNLLKSKPTAAQVAKSLVLRFLSVFCRRNVQKAGLKSSDFFYGVLHAGNMVSIIYQNIFEKLRPGVTEIICHPGFESNTDGSPGLGRYFLDNTRKAELDALLDGGLRQELRSRKIRLSNFGEL